MDGPRCSKVDPGSLGLISGRAIRLGRLRYQASSNSDPLGLPEVAEVLGVGRTTVYRLTSSSQLPSIQIGKRRLIPVHVLNEWIRALATAAGEPPH